MPVSPAEKLAHRPLLFIGRSSTARLLCRWVRPCVCGRPRPPESLVLRRGESGPCINQGNPHRREGSPRDPRSQGFHPWLERPATGRASAETRECAAEAGDRLMEAVRSLRQRLEDEFGFLTAGEDKWEAVPILPLYRRDSTTWRRRPRHLFRFRVIRASTSRSSRTRTGAIQGPFLARRSISGPGGGGKGPRDFRGAPILLSDVASQADDPRRTPAVSRDAVARPGLTGVTGQR